MYRKVHGYSKEYRLAVAFMFPTKEQFKVKWWYRLLSVLLTASTIVLGMVMFFEMGLFEVEPWFGFPYSYYIYSYQRDYLSKNGKEENCKFDLLGHKPTKSSGMGALDFSDIPGVNPSVIECGDLSPSNFSVMYCEYAENPPNLCKTQSPSTNEIIAEGLSDGTLNNVRAKWITERTWAELFVRLGIVAIVVCGWFLLLKFLVYPSIFYVIFGKKNKH